LRARSLWFDEALSASIAKLGAVQVLTNAAGSSHPPGYYFLLHLWRPIGGSEFALRFPSAWFSLLAVALVARLGRDFFGPRAAWLATLGMAIAPFQVYYAQEARMYGMVIALSAGLLWAFLRGVRGRQRGAWWLYGVLVALGLYIHYYVALLVLALHLWLLLDWGRVQRAFPTLLVADGVAAAAFVPQLMQFRIEAGEFLGSARWRVTPSPLEPVRTLHYLLFGHVMPLWLVPVALFLLLGLLAIGMLWGLRRGAGELGKLFLVVVLVPIVAALGVSLLVTPVYVERSFAVVTPALMALLARCIAVAPRRSPAIYLGAALGLLLALGTLLYHVLPDPAKPPLREAMAAVERQALAEDAVWHLQDASYLPSLYDGFESGGALADVGQRLWLSPEKYALFGGQVVEPGDLITDGRLWLVVMPGYVESAQVEWLRQWDAQHSYIELWDWGSVQVRLYACGGEG
jgi:uncharacterized membrane protein